VTDHKQTLAKYTTNNIFVTIYNNNNYHKQMTRLALAKTIVSGTVTLQGSTFTFTASGSGTATADRVPEAKKLAVATSNTAAITAARSAIDKILLNNSEVLADLEITSLISNNLSTTVVAFKPIALSSVASSSDGVNYTLNPNVTIGTDQWLTVPTGKTLYGAPGNRLTNNGYLQLGDRTQKSSSALKSGDGCSGITCSDFSVNNTSDFSINDGCCYTVSDNCTNSSQININSGGCLTINNGVTLTNSGSSSAILNQQGGTCTNYGTITNSGSYSYVSNEDTFTNSGTITNSGSYSYVTNQGTFTNSGSITNSESNSYVLNQQGGTCTNSGSITNSESYSAIQNKGTFTNSGSITNSGSHSTISNEENTFTNNTDGSITNSGSYSAIQNEHTFTNSGSITNSGSYSIIQNEDTFTNSGSITNSGSYSAIQNEYTFTNSGSITNSGSYSVIKNEYTFTNNTDGSIANLGFQSFTISICPAIWTTNTGSICLGNCYINNC
jgi:hypothetical protein